MKHLTSYLRTIFGTQMWLEEYHIYGNLPMYLTDNYQLCKLQVDADKYVLAKPKDAIKLNVTTIKKQLAQIQKYTSLPPVLVLENLRLSQRNALVQARIAFVVPEKQLYIPHYVMNLTEIESSIEDYGEQFTVATQVVFFYLLLQQIKETNAHQLSEQLPYSVATINRALKELCYRKLLQTVGNGTRKQYIISSGRQFWENGKQYLFDPVKSSRYVKRDFGHHGFQMSNDLALRKQYIISSGRQFWENGKQYLFDPVKSSRYVKRDFGHHGFQMSNDLALSRLSFLNGGSTNYYASSAQNFKTIDKEEILNAYDVFDHDYCIVEIFRYDPKILSQGNYIDVFSLYAQFKDDKDERVQIEIESLDHDYCIVEIFRYDPKILSQGNYIDVFSLYAQFKDDKDERVQIEIESLVNEHLW